LVTTMSSLSTTYMAILLLFVFVNIPTAAQFDQEKQEECPLLEGGPLLEVAERICEFCHEISNHEKPNMRSECRSSCFSSDHFRTCVNIFSSTSTQPRRHIRSRHRIRHIWV
uniref:Uncharacterized protein n=1 Tax=Haemonchus contortus TaxID=6289 RepID=A0A912MS92_HAECO